MGFEFPTSESNGTHHTIFLKVNASESVNNTKITCHFSTDGQPLLRHANLSVIAGNNINAMLYSHDYNDYE